MPADRQSIQKYLPAISLLLVMAGLLFSRAVLSIGVVLLFMSALFFSKQPLSYFPKSAWFYIPLLFLVFTLFDFLRAESSSSWNKDLEINVLWVVMAFSVSKLHNLQESKLYPWLRIIFYCMVALINAISVIQYLLNREAIDLLLLQSKHIPIAGGMHHIYFGILNAGLILLKLSEWLIFRKEAHARWSKFEWAGVTIILISMHVLSSRTGLFSFYIVLLSILIFAAIQWKERRKIISWVLLLAIVFPVISYITLPSFRNKIANTSEDIKATEKGGEDVNFKSMGMRKEAWKTAIEIIRSHPFIGVGSGNVESAMSKQYEKNQSLLIAENRIGPHNQFLEFGIKNGLIGILLLLSLFIYLLVKGLRTQNLPLLATLALFSISFMLESVLERQHGIIIFALAFFWCQSEK
jgi:O-antigen ligase